MRAFQIPGTMRQLRWWLAVQSVYAREIGESFAKPQNDNAKPIGKKEGAFFQIGPPGIFSKAPTWVFRSVL